MNKPVSGSVYRNMGAWGEELRVFAQKDPNMTVSVNEGIFYTDGMNLIEYEGGNSPVIKKPSKGNEWVVICLNKQGTLYVAEGKPANKPELPQLEKHYLPLAAIYLTSTTAKITSDMIFDIRPRFVSGGYHVDHADIEGVDVANSHPISAITNLRETLDAKVEFSDLEKLDNKIDNLKGTNTATFVLNQAQTGTPYSNVGITVNRGEENNVGIRFNENKGTWEFTNDGSVWNEFVTAISIDGNLKDATATAKGVVKLSVEPQDAFAPIAVGDNDPRIAAIEFKADKDDVYTKEEVDEKIADKITENFTYSRQSIDEMLNGKMDVDTIYTEAEIDAKLMGKADVGDCYEKAESDLALAEKADKDTVYTKEEVDEAVAVKADADVVESALAVKADADSVYTKEEVDVFVNTLGEDKANKSDVYDRAQVDLLLEDKADKANVYDRAQIDGMNLLKADKTDVYTQSEVDEALALKANAETTYSKVDVDNALILKADKDDVYNKADADVIFASQANTYAKADVDSLLEGKADKIDVYSKDEAELKLAEKANTEDVFTKSEVDDLLADKANVADVFSKVEMATELLPYAKNDDVITRLGNYAKIADVFTKAEVNLKLNDKANTDDVNIALAEKADKAQYYSAAVVDSKLANYATVEDVNVLRTQSVKLADVYTKEDIDAKLKDKGNKAELVNLLSTKADDTDLLAYYDRSEIDEMLKAYAKSAVVGSKADKNEVYTKADADSLFVTSEVLKEYAKKADVLTPSDLTASLADYALVSDLETKASKASVEAVKADVEALKAEKDTHALKADLADVVRTADIANFVTADAVADVVKTSDLDEFVKKSDAVSSVVLTSEDGSKFSLSVDNDGNLTAVKMD